MTIQVGDRLPQTTFRVMTPDGYPIYQQSTQCPGAFVVTCHSGVTLAANHVFTIAPWLAGATVLVYTYARFDPRQLLDVLAHTGATTFCAPPTVWRMLVQHDLASARHSLREVLSAGEPLNPEVIRWFRDQFGVTVLDYYGLTESYPLCGNYPSVEVR